MYFDLKDIKALITGLFFNRVDIFEKQFARYIGIKYAIATSFGRTALYTGLKAIDVKDGEVIIPSFICTVVRHAVVLAGATPVFADINYRTFEYNISDLERKLNKNTKAIVLVHYFGGVAQNFKKIVEFAKKYKIYLIEDCAHSLGAQIDGRKTGSFGDFAIFSLTKNLINCGGGVLTTNDDAIAIKARRVLSDNKVTIKKRIIDFPLILMYGYDQYINKILLDRVKIRKFEKLLINNSIWMRDIYSLLFKIFGRLRKINNIAVSQDTKKRNIPLSKGEPEFYKQGIHMEPVIASLGITQLRKTDQLKLKRENIYLRLKELKPIRPVILNGDRHSHVYTNVLLEFSNKDIFKIKYCFKQSGINLGTTWPTHQRIWDDQDSESVRSFQKNILILNVNPDLNDKEIKIFKKVAETIKEFKSGL